MTNSSKAEAHLRQVTSTPCCLECTTGMVMTSRLEAVERCALLWPDCTSRGSLSCSSLPCTAPILSTAGTRSARSSMHVFCAWMCSVLGDGGQHEGGKLAKLASAQQRTQQT